MTFHFRLSILLFFVFFYNSLHAQSGWHFTMTPVYGITDRDQAKQALQENSVKYNAWDENYRQQFQQQGTDYFLRHPHDTAFSNWFIQTTGELQPYYWKHPEACAENLAAYQLNGVPRVPEYDSV